MSGSASSQSASRQPPPTPCRSPSPSIQHTPLCGLHCHLPLSPVSVISAHTKPAGHTVGSSRQLIEQYLPIVSWMQASWSSPQSSSVEHIAQNVSCAGTHTRVSTLSICTVWHA